jgi:hypothetical protein
VFLLTTQLWWVALSGTTPAGEWFAPAKESLRVHLLFGTAPPLGQPFRPVDLKHSFMKLMILPGLPCVNGYLSSKNQKNPYFSTNYNFETEKTARKLLNE